MEMPPPSVLGTATLFCRPLRFLFDVEKAVAVLRNDAHYSPSSPSSREEDAVLGHVHVHVSLSIPDDEPMRPAAVIPPQRYEELTDLVGRFVWMRVRLQLPQESEGSSALRRWRVQYQLSPATESFLLPADHTNVFRVLVTDELITHVATTALQFSFLPSKLREEEEDHTCPTLVDTRPAATPIAVSTPASSEEAEAARRLTETAANAAYSAAEAAREAARAATHAMEEAKAVAHQRGSERDADAKAMAERDRQHKREQELERDRERVAIQARDIRADAEAKAQAIALTKQQLDHERERLSEEKQRLQDDATRLTRALEEKDVAMGKWTQQTATTDAAIELLKQRLDGDAREREQLQQRLRVLEEEKLELLRKSRACVVQ